MLKRILQDRKAAWVGVFGGNLVLFTLMAYGALERVHHHWIVPGFSGLLLAEAWLVKKYFGAARALWLRGLLLWVLVTAGILGWRQFSMFQCYMHCEGRLAFGLVFLSGAAYFITAGLERQLEKLVAVILCSLLLLWCGVVLSLALLRGTLTLF
jgi:hypothetical protein